MTGAVIARDWAHARVIVESERRTAAAAARERSAGQPLTARERQVVALILQGLAHKQVADNLGITDSTLRAHMTAILRKTGASDRLTVALWALRERGILPPEEYHG